MFEGNNLSIYCFERYLRNIRIVMRSLPIMSQLDSDQYFPKGNLLPISVTYL